MPLLAQLMASLFGSLAGFFATWVTKKAALGAAAVSVFAILTLALMAAIATAINTALHVFSVPHWFAVGFNLFMPPSFVAGVAAIIAAHAAVALYRWNVENLKILAYVT